jgi:hypothetical protein
MPPDTQPKEVDAALKAVFLLIGDEKLQRRLQDEQEFSDALDRLGLPHDARGGLLDIINKLASRRARQSDTHPASTPTPESPSEVQRILLESFVHIRWSFWISIAMSVILFLLGLVFFGTALMQSLQTQEVTSSTLTIAGLGLADFVLLFYTRPWKDVATNLANSQQIRMIATSYLACFALIRNGTPEQRKALEELTERSVGLVQRYVEEGDAEARFPKMSNSEHAARQGSAKTEAGSRG